MKSTRAIGRAARILALIGLSLGVSGTLREAHAGGGGLPHIEAIMVSRDVSHCTQQGNAASCYTTTEISIQVDGAGFIHNGSVQVEIEDAHTLAVTYDRIVQAGPTGLLQVGTGQPYCTKDGRLVRAYDLTLHLQTNTVAISPCGLL